MTEKKRALLLFSNLLGDLPHHEPYLPNSVDKAVKTIDGLIAESEKEGRRFLSRFGLEKPVHLIPIALLNKHTLDQDIDFLLEPLMKGERWGVISDAGMPCIADPGAKLVRRSRVLGIPVQFFVGPSAITMALALSGFSGQSFSFHGYLSKEDKEAVRDLKKMEKQVQQSGSTQIWMERPYRNQKHLELLLENLADETQLCIAWNLTLQGQSVVTQSVELWKKSPLPNLDKKPAVFLLGV